MNEGRRGLSQKPRTGEMRTRGPAIARDHRNNIMTYGLLRAVLTAMVLSGAWASIPSASNAAMEGREVLDLLNRAKGGDTTAIDDLRQKADTGDPVAQTGLATAYLAGIGVAKDDAEAARLTRLAADQGFPPAEYDLALLILPAVAFQRTSASRQNGWRKRRPKESHQRRTTSDCCTRLGKACRKT